MSLEDCNIYEQLSTSYVVFVHPLISFSFFKLHFYQPMWTLVGGGIKKKEESSRPMGSLIPDGADWYKDRVAKLDPDNNTLSTVQGDVLKYDFLIVAIGFELNIPAVNLLFLNFGALV